MTNIATPSITNQANGSFAINEAVASNYEALMMKHEILKKMECTLSGLIGIIDKHVDLK